MFKRKKEGKEMTNVIKGVAAATAAGLTAGILLKQKTGNNSLDSVESKIVEIKETVTGQAEELKSRMHKETEQKVKDVRGSVAEAATAMDEINAIYKKAKHEMKQIAKDAQKQIEAMR